VLTNRKINAIDGNDFFNYGIKNNNDQFHKTNDGFRKNKSGRNKINVECDNMKVESGFIMDNMKVECIGISQILEKNWSWKQISKKINKIKQTIIIIIIIIYW